MHFLQEGAEPGQFLKRKQRAEQSFGKFAGATGGGLNFTQAGRQGGASPSQAPPSKLMSWVMCSCIL